MSVKYKTKFQDHWLNDNNYKQWVQKFPNNLYSVKCEVCLKVISVAGLGKIC